MVGILLRGRSMGRTGACLLVLALSEFVRGHGAKAEELDGSTLFAEFASTADSRESGVQTVSSASSV